MSRRTKRFPLAAAGLGLALSMLPSPAFADQLNPAGPDRWEHYAHAVGDCGEGAGHYVRTVQAFTWANNNLADWGVDGWWGPNSRTALTAWQQQHGLSGDGCAGFFTWDRFGHSSQIAFLGYAGGGYWARFRWKEWWNSKYITMDSSPHAWWFQWFDGWHPVDHNFNNWVPVYNWDSGELEGYDTH